MTASGVTDGPFVEAKEIVGGYMIVAAESYEQAIEVAKEMPGMVMPGARIEIREMAGPERVPNADGRRAGLVEHFFRHEYGRLVAMLTRMVGVRHVELVEDAVQTAS